MLNRAPINYMAVQQAAATDVQVRVDWQDCLVFHTRTRLRKQHASFNSMQTFLTRSVDPKWVRISIRGT